MYIPSVLLINSLISNYKTTHLVAASDNYSFSFSEISIIYLNDKINLRLLHILIVIISSYIFILTYCNYQIVLYIIIHCKKLNTCLNMSYMLTIYYATLKKLIYIA